jgi:hypothetical protein
MTSLHSSSRRTRFTTTPDALTVAPTAKANEFRAVSMSALVKTVCIAINPNVSIFGFLIISLLFADFDILFLRRLKIHDFYSLLSLLRLSQLSHSTSVLETAKTVKQLPI